MVHPLSSTRSQTFEERPATFSWASVRQDFASSPTRVQSAFKLALGCSLTMIVAFLFDWPSPATAMIPPLLLSRADIRYDLRQSLCAGGWALVMGSFYVWSLNFSQSPLWFALVLGSGLVVSGTLNRLPSIGSALSIGQVVPSVVLANYFFAPNARQGIFLPTTMELTLGFGVAIAVSYLFWPYAPRQEWDQRFRRAWEVCRRHMQAWFAQDESARTLARRPGPLDRQLEETLALLTDRIKAVDHADEGAAVRQAAARQLQEIIIRLQDLERLGPGDLPATDPAGFRRLGESLDDRFRRLGRLLAADASVASAGPPGPDDPGARLEGMEAPPGDLRRDDLRRLVETLDHCPETFRALSRLPEAEAVTRREQSLAWSPPPRWQELRQLGVAQIHHGVKIALIVLASLGLWQALRWPSGGTVVASALIVTLTNLGLSSRQAINRIWGLLLGLLCAFLSIVLVVKYVETIVGFGLCVFLVLFALAYLGAASPRLAYVGFQGAVTYVLVFVGDDRQSISLEPLRERFVALTLGVVIAMVILHNLWPEREVKTLFKALADNLALCADAWTTLRQAGGAEWRRAHEKFVRDFNTGWAKTTVLINTVEFEGGEGTPRYGYAGRLLTHEVALFEQVHLFSLDWAELAAVDGSLSTRAEAIGERLQTLARHLGHAAERPPTRREAVAAPAASAEDPGNAARWPVVAHRAGEIEQILASLERLTGMAPSS